MLEIQYLFAIPGQVIPFGGDLEWYGAEVVLLLVDPERSVPLHIVFLCHQHISIFEMDCRACVVSSR